MEEHLKGPIIYPLQIHSHSEKGKYLIIVPKEKDIQNINPIKIEYPKRIMQSILCKTSDTIHIDILQSI